MGGRGDRNSVLLLTASLNILYNFLSSMFPQVHTNVKFIETHLHFI
jgi:hypothetical protein